MIARPQLTDPSTAPAWRVLYRAGRSLTVAALVLALLAAQTSASFAVGLIRDAEIEELMLDYATPILRAANLSTQNVNIHIVNDKSFNAFVIDGQNMFFHVGAITKSLMDDYIAAVHPFAPAPAKKVAAR